MEVLDPITSQIGTKTTGPLYMPGPNPTEPINYTDSYTTDYRVIIAGLVK